MDILAYREGVFGRIFGRIDEKIGDFARQGLVNVGQAEDALFVRDGLQEALSIQTLRSSSQGDRAVQLAYSYIFGQLHFRFLKGELTAIANAFFQQEADI
jgi:hypothetical protein